MRLAEALAEPVGSRRYLVTGGVRSGKSVAAESLLRGHAIVTYIAPGQPADPARDAEWAARVAAHQARRAAHWETLETADVTAALATVRTPVLLDCVGTWLTRQLDDLGAWDGREGWQPVLAARVDALAAAWQVHPGPAVAVTNEVGWGLVPPYPSGRIFTDWLGRTNVALADASDRVWLVAAGRVVAL